MGFNLSPDAERHVREQTQPQMYALAKEIADEAGRLAPRGIRIFGANRNSYKVRVRQSDDGPITSVDSTDQQAAHIVEYGTARTPEFAPLRRAIRALGLRLRDYGAAGASGRSRGPSRLTRTQRMGGDD